MAAGDIGGSAEAYSAHLRIKPEEFVLSNRTSSVAKDGLIKNAFYEAEADSIVKRPGLVLSSEQAGTCGSGVYAFEDDLIAVVDDEVRLIGSTSSFSAYELRSNSLPFRYRGGAFSYGGALYVTGGIGPGPAPYTTHVYKSTDGAATWSLIKSSPVYGDRSDFGFCVHDGKMWISGGTMNGGGAPEAHNNDVFSSSDGITWATVRVDGAGGGFTKTSRHTMISFDDRLWIVSGGVSGDRSDDVWYSNDGISWTLAAGTPGWNKRENVGLGVHNNKLWMIGGYDGTSYKNDVWSSSDGVTWTLATASAGFSGRVKPAVFSKNGFLYCGFGYNGAGGTVRDLWKSADGINWSQVHADQTSIALTPSGILHSDGGLYVFQVLDEASPSPNNQVWRSALDLGSESLGTITTADPGTVNNPGTICEQVDFAEIQSSPFNSLFLKTERDAWRLRDGILTPITDTDYPSLTVPGAVSLDGYIFVMTPKGEIYNSNLDNMLAWEALDFINAEVEADTGIAIAKHLNYIMAFGEWTTEFFYNNANETNSPLARMEEQAMWIGCANARSIVNVGNSVIWMGKDRTKGRFIMAMEGLQAQRVSTPSIDRILNASPNITVRSMPLSVGGHLFYVLDMIDDNLTLVFDLYTKSWYIWTYLNDNATNAVTSITRSGETATVTRTAHGFSEGEVVTISGANQADYDGSFVIHNVAANTFDITVRNSPATPATGTILVKNYTERSFLGTYYATLNGLNYIQDPATGDIYEVLESYYDDAGAPIKYNIRTRQVDITNLLAKFISHAEVYADQESSLVSYRHTDDDYQTYSKFRDRWMNGRVKFHRTGSTRRRAFELMHIANTAVRVHALDIFVSSGTH